MDGLAVERDRAAAGAGDAEDRLHQLAAPRADQPVEAEDLALAQLEGDAVELGRVREVGDGKHRRADVRRALREDVVDGAADHHLDDGVLRGVGQKPLAHHLAVAEDGVAVGDAENLIELVADEEDRLALALQEFDEQKELLDLLGRECGGRLVHDDDLRVDRHGARDRDEVLVGDAEVAQPRVGVDVAGMHRVEHFARVGAHGLPVDRAEAGARRVAEKDVLGHREVVEQHGLLVDGGDAVLEGLVGAGKMDGLAADADLAGVGLVDAGEDLHQRRLAGAVLADQRGDLAGIERQADIVERAHAGEGFRDAGKREQRRGRVRLAASGLQHRERCRGCERVQ